MASLTDRGTSELDLDTEESLGLNLYEVKEDSTLSSLSLGSDSKDDNHHVAGVSITLFLFILFCFAFFHLCLHYWHKYLFFSFLFCRLRITQKIQRDYFVLL